jgi:hypothetical protein
MGQINTALANVIPEVELSFVQKNMVGYLRRFGGKMKYRDLCLRMNYTQFTHEEWVNEYSKLIGKEVVRQYLAPSEKHPKMKVAWVELIATDLPIYGIVRLDEQKREALQKEWFDKGLEDFKFGVPRKEFNKQATAPKYTRKWYIQREGWLAGHDEGNSKQAKLVDGVLE